MRKYLILSLALLSSYAFACEGGQHKLTDWQKDEKYFIKGPLNIFDLEKENLIKIRETGTFLPFGYANKDWEALKSMIKSGDLIYFISHSDGRLMMSGHGLVRENCVIKFNVGSIT